MEPEALFEENLELIDRLTASIAARNGMFGADAEDFASWARLRVIDNDYAILQKFQGRAKLSTYLNTVLHNLFRDYRIHKWGKWRASTAAKRLGREAVLLERLVVRDGHEVGSAVRMMRENAGVDRSAEELEALLAQLPRRVQKREVGGEVLESIGHLDGTEGRVKDAEREAIATTAEEALVESMKSLEAEDRLILKLRFKEGWTLARVARSLHLEQKPLYRRVNGTLATLRQNLERSGLDHAAIERLVQWPGLDLTVNFEAEGENPDSVRPNPRQEG